MVADLISCELCTTFPRQMAFILHQKVKGHALPVPPGNLQVCNITAILNFAHLLAFLNAIQLWSPTQYHLDTVTFWKLSIPFLSFILSFPSFILSFPSFILSFPQLLAIWFSVSPSQLTLWNIKFHVRHGFSQLPRPILDKYLYRSFFVPEQPHHSLLSFNGYRLCSWWTGQSQKCLWHWVFWFQNQYSPDFWACCLHFIWLFDRYCQFFLLSIFKLTELPHRSCCLWPISQSSRSATILFFLIVDLK